MPFRLPSSAAFVDWRMQPIVLFWFRRKLRLDDNAGLHAVLSSGFPVAPLFIFDQDILHYLGDRDDKRVSFIYTALQAMQKGLQKQGSTLNVRYGKPAAVFAKLMTKYAVQAVYTNGDYEPCAKLRDESMGQLLAGKGIPLYTFKDQVLFERAEVTKDDGSGYAMYAPYAKMWKARLSKEDCRSHPSEKSANTSKGNP